MKEIEEIMLFLWRLFVLLFLLLILLHVREINAAESDSLYYVSATDMIEKVDSVIGVCDTTCITVIDMETGYATGEAVCDSFRFVLDTIGTEITCRELICVVPVSKPSKRIVRGLILAETGQIALDIIPGQIVVWWREVVQ